MGNRAVVRLFLIVAICCPAVLQAQRYHTDSSGTYYNEVIFYSDGYVKQKHYIKRFYNYDQKPPTVTGVGRDSKISSERVTEPVRNEADRQKTVAKAEANGDVVDKTLGVEGYRFGEAGATAAGQAFVYGVAVQLTSDPAQAARIQRLRNELDALNQAIQEQAKTHADENRAFTTALAERGQSLTDAVGAVARLPRITSADPLLAGSDGETLFATSDAFFALRLNRLARRINSNQYKVPGSLRQAGLAAVRLADLDSARGDTESAESFANIAKTVADLAIGLDPITGAARGLYELVSGKNLITGQPINSFERAVAVINVATVGGFGAIESAVHGLTILGHVLSGHALTSISSAISALPKFFSYKTIDTLLAFRNAGKAALEEGTVLFNKAKPILVEFPSDQRFARVMSRDLAEKVIKGAPLSSKDMAFVTAAEDVAKLDSKQAIARKLALYSDTDAKILRKLDTEVLVEFKFTAADNPLLSNAIGKPNSWGLGWIPGGFTAGGAREWLVDSNAVSSGLIDRASIAIRDLPKQ